LKLHADENVDFRIVLGLRRRGIEVSTAADAKLLGHPDTDHVQYAAQHCLLLLSGDRDHLRIFAEHGEAGRPHPGLLYYHPRHVPIGTVVREVERILKLMPDEQLRGQLHFIAASPDTPPATPSENGPS
jgi:hypothetical protein